MHVPYETALLIGFANGAAFVLLGLIIVLRQRSEVKGDAFASAIRSVVGRH